MKFAACFFYMLLFYWTLYLAKRVNVRLSNMVSPQCAPLNTFFLYFVELFAIFFNSSLHNAQSFRYLCNHANSKDHIPLIPVCLIYVIIFQWQALKDPQVECLNRNKKIFLAIDNTFRILANNCYDVLSFRTFECSIDAFGVSSDDNLVVLCLNDGSIHCLHIPTNGKLVCSAWVD